MASRLLGMCKKAVWINSHQRCLHLTLRSSWFGRTILSRVDEVSNRQQLETRRDFSDGAHWIRISGKVEINRNLEQSTRGWIAFHLAKKLVFEAALCSCHCCWIRHLPSFTSEEGQLSIQLINSSVCQQLVFGGGC